ncbi:L,D-transpeptidase family protein [Hungatella hathewayi]
MYQYNRHQSKKRKKSSAHVRRKLVCITAVIMGGICFLITRQMGDIVRSNTVDIREERLLAETVTFDNEPENEKEIVDQPSQKETRPPFDGFTVTYHFGDRSEVLDGDTICGWLTDDGEETVTISREAVAEYVQNLAETYNTAYCAKKFVTTGGAVVTINRGHYGWMIDKAAETEALMTLLEAGESVDREPIYAQTAASHDGPDYGDTYVEMNLTAQHLYYYKHGKLVVESDFVSGDEAKGFSTPAGAYELTYKQRNATLKGKNYNTPVSYWLPFNGNIGMHDGYWRNEFGGDIYKKNGSHGCINLPPAIAKTIYENIEAGTPVLCYHLEGSESKKTTVLESKAAASKREEAPDSQPPESEPPASQLPESEASASQPPESESPVSQPPEVEPPASQPPSTTPQPDSTVILEGPGVETGCIPEMEE